VSDAKSAPKGGRKARTLGEEIAAQRDKLRKLEERQREQKRKEQERNTKAVLELIRAEKLDAVPAEQWKLAMPAIKAALLVDSSPQPEAGATSQKTDGQGEPAASGQ
jgi:hypothetical protein